MDTEQKHAGEGTSVDSEKQPKVKLSGPQRPSDMGSTDHKHCPQCGYTLTSVEKGIYVTQDRICDEQMDVDQTELQRALKDLESVTSRDCSKYAQHLMDKKTIHSPELLPFFSLLAKSFPHPETPETSDKGRGSRTLSLQMRMYRPRLRISSVVTGPTFGADDTILKQVSNVRSLGKVVMTRDLRDCDIIIIFCPIVSRVGSDVEAAMGNITGQKPAILVLMHHTRDVDYSTSRRKWSEKYPNVKLDVHVLYHETRAGLLDCQQNKEAIKEIQEELEKHSRWRWA